MRKFVTIFTIALLFITCFTFPVSGTTTNAEKKPHEMRETLDILKRNEIKKFKEKEVMHENKEQDDIYISRNFQKRQEVDIHND